MENQQEQFTQKPAEQTEQVSQEKVTAEVQPTTAKDEVVQYRALQSKADKAMSEKEKLEGEVRKLRSDLKRQEVIRNNPLLEPFLQNIDLSEMTNSEINAACEELLTNLESYHTKRKGSPAPKAEGQTTEEAPEVAPPANSVTNSNLNSLTPEAIAKMSRKDLKKILESKGMFN